MSQSNAGSRCEKISFTYFMVGHLFVIEGDLKKLACDAWALPTDDVGQVTTSFADAVGLTGGGILAQSLEDGWIIAPFAHEERIWLLNIGGFASTPSARYAERAAEFVRRASAKLGATRGAGRGKPPVAVNGVGTGDGGHGDEKGSVFRDLIPALTAAAEEQADCDVVLVAYDEDAYSAAQRGARPPLGQGLGRMAANTAKCGSLTMAGTPHHLRFRGPGRRRCESEARACGPIASPWSQSSRNHLTAAFQAAGNSK